VLEAQQSFMLAEMLVELIGTDRKPVVCLADD